MFESLATLYGRVPIRFRPEPIPALRPVPLPPLPLHPLAPLPLPPMLVPPVSLPPLLLLTMSLPYLAAQFLTQGATDGILIFLAYAICNILALQQAWTTQMHSHVQD